MKKRLSVGITGLLIFGAILTNFNFMSENTKGTFVSGIQYDGFGGPWTTVGSPYIVIGSVIVPTGQTLTIQSGVEVKFDGHYSIYVDGDLTAIGTETSRIYITSNKPIPSLPDWEKIQVNISGHAEIKYANINWGAYGLYLFSSSNTVTNSNISSNRVDGIHLESSSNNFIINNTLLMNGIDLIEGAGISLVLSTDNTIIDNVVSNNRNDGIYHLSSSNNTIINNTLSYNSRYAIELDSSSSNRIINNTLCNGNSNIYLHSSSNNNEITDNRISNSLWGIELYNSLKNNILNNTINGINERGINLVSSSSNNVSFNKISNIGLNLRMGISLSASSDNNINNNKVSKGEYGINIESNSNNNSIKNNYIANNSAHGIFLFSTSYNNMTNNNVLYNGICNFCIFGSSNTSIVKNNASYGGAGIQISSSSNYNTIIKNNVLKNDYGFHLWSSTNNRIYHNKIIKNTNQAYDDMSNNFWNDTYPSGGNYWSDYSPACQDLYNGATTPQTMGSPDNICDIQYNIDANSADFYPTTMAPPTNLSAELTGDNLENVTISWDASKDDPGKVINYAVYFGLIYNNSGANYNFLTKFPAVGASKYYLTVICIGEGNPNSYFFSVQANASLEYSKSDVQVAKFRNGLTTGKKLVSIPLILNNTTVSSVLQTLRFNIAWYYDNSDLLDPWKSYNPLKNFNDLTMINHTMALWIDVSENSNLTVAGIVPKVMSIQLKAGWNFVSYPSFIERTVADAFNEIDYERIEGYSPLGPENLRIYNDGDLMMPGYGYWIKVRNDIIWTLNN